MSESSLITSVGAFLLGGGAIALFWRPLFTGIAAIVTNNRASGDIISNYKEQVLLLRENNELLRTENDALRDEQHKNLRRISSLETDLRLIKNSLSLLLAMSSPTGNEQLRNEINRLIATLKDDSNDTGK